MAKNVKTTGCIYCGKRTTSGGLICAACRRVMEIGYKKGDNEHDIALLARAARTLGLSYGQGVARYGERELLARAGMLPG